MSYSASGEIGDIGARFSVLCSSEHILFLKGLKWILDCSDKIGDFEHIPHITKKRSTFRNGKPSFFIELYPKSPISPIFTEHIGVNTDRWISSVEDW